MDGGGGGGGRGGQTIPVSVQAHLYYVHKGAARPLRRLAIEAPS